MSTDPAYPQSAIDHALKWADEQKDGPPGFWNDLRALAWAYRLAKSEQERFERLFQAETRARSRLISDSAGHAAERDRLKEVNADLLAAAKHALTELEFLVPRSDAAPELRAAIARAEGKS